MPAVTVVRKTLFGGYDRVVDELAALEVVVFDLDHEVIGAEGVEAKEAFGHQAFGVDRPQRDMVIHVLLQAGQGHDAIRSGAGHRQAIAGVKLGSIENHRHALVDKVLVVPHPERNRGRGGLEIRIVRRLHVGDERRDIIRERRGDDDGVVIRHGIGANRFIELLVAIEREIAGRDVRRRRIVGAIVHDVRGRRVDHRAFPEDRAIGSIEDFAGDRHLALVGVETQHQGDVLVLEFGGHAIIGHEILLDAFGDQHVGGVLGQTIATQRAGVVPPRIRNPCQHGKSILA